MFGKFQTMYFHNRFIQVEMGRGNMKKCSLTLWIWLYFNMTAEICDGCEFNYFRLIANFFENDNHSITVLRQHGVLPNSVKCPKCNKLCLLRQDKWQWRCTGSVKDKKHKSRKRCSYNISNRKGSSCPIRGSGPRFRPWPIRGSGGGAPGLVG